MLAIFSKASAQAATVSATDQSWTSNTTLADVTSLSFKIGAGETWVATWMLSATFSAAGQIRVAVTTPAGATQLIVAQMAPNAIVPAFGTTGTSGTGVALVSALSTAGVVTVTASVVNGATAGTVALQAAQNASDGTATTIKAASSLIARKA